MGIIASHVRAGVTALSDITCSVILLSIGVTTLISTQSWKNPACCSHGHYKEHSPKMASTSTLMRAARPTSTFPVGARACLLLSILPSRLAFAPTWSLLPRRTPPRQWSIMKTSNAPITTQRSTARWRASLSCQWSLRQLVGVGVLPPTVCSPSLPKIKPASQASSRTQLLPTSTKA